jgi:hypothetical protein
VGEGIDPHGAKVAELGGVYANTKGLADECDSAEALEKALTSPRVHSTSWRVEKVRREALETLQKYILPYALAAKPIDRRRTNLPRQAAIKLGMSWGWTPEAIAAALVLTGAVKLVSDFRAVKHDVGEAFSCVQKSRK